MPRMAGIVLDVASEANHKIIDRTSIGIFVQAPDLFQNLFSGDDAAVVAHEMPQEFRFHQSKLDGGAARTQFEGSEIDGLAAKRETSKVADAGAIHGRGLHAGS